jgi:SAM-dependent methyltransferase
MKRLRYFAHPLATLAPRDLLLMEALEAGPMDQVLEVGTGSGSSLFRLAGSVAALHGVDVSEGPIARLRRALARARGPAREIQLFTLDFCDPESPSRLPTRYNVIFSCDTLEHVPAPGPFFANIHAALKPGGRLFLTFPNESPEVAHGITFFEYQSQLRELIEAAGFPPDQIRLEILSMNHTAERVMTVGWEKPRGAIKGVLKRLRRGDNDGAPPPQTFDETDFFSMADRFEPFAPIINAYCWGVMGLMSLAHPVYQIQPAPEPIWNTRILIRARRSEIPND